MNPKLVKTEADYEAALARVSQLMSARPGTSEGDELELWAHLVEEYEEEHYPIDLPDPIAAIRFRMDQQDLKAADLIPYIGSKSKVSEVLNRKRPLSLAMIRKLHSGLGIPAEILLQDVKEQLSPALEDMNWREFPLAEIVKRRWLGDSVKTARQLLDRAEEILGPYLSPPGLCRDRVRLRRTAGKEGPAVEKALWAWKARVWHLAHDEKVEQYDSGAVDEDLIGEIARLSRLDNGPAVARDMLAKIGVRLVFEPQLPGTKLDGAAIRSDDGLIIIGMTLRHDRLDNYWFTLCHELAHLVLHLKQDGCRVFMDDLEADNPDSEEREADRLAQEALVPKARWTPFKERARGTRSEIVSFALSQRLHPAIIAGRWRRETGNYRVFGDLLGRGKVRQLLLR